MVFLAFAVGAWLGSVRERRVGIPSGTVMDLTVWILISSLLGARLTYVFAHLDEFQGRWLDVINPIQSDGTIGIAGLVLLGGVATAIPTAAWYLKRKGIPFLKMMDVLIPSLAFGIALGRIGCLLNGCCFGRVTALPWGMLFPADCLAGYYFPNQRLHPTQLYEFIYCVAIAAFLLLRTPRRRFEGELFYWFLTLYGIARFWNESIRYYTPKLIPLHLGTLQVTGSMLLSAAMTLIGGYYLFRGFKKRSRSVRS